MVDENRQWFKLHHGLNETETPRDLAFCAHAIDDPEKTLEVPDPFKDNPLVIGEPRVRFYAGAPLVNEEGYVLETLCVIDHEPKALSQVHRDALKALARQVTTQLELRRKNEKLKVYKRIFDMSMDMICIADINKLVFKEINKSFSKGLGMEIEGLKERNVLDFIHPDDIHSVKKEVKWLRKGESTYDFQVRFLCANGLYRWFDWTAVPDRYSSKIFAIGHDVTEIKGAKEKLEKKNRELVRHFILPCRRHNYINFHPLSF